MKNNRLLLLLCCLSLVLSATAIILGRSNKKNKTVETTQIPAATGEALVRLHTTAGDITVRLFADTPIHRDNFLKLVDDGFYNGVLFHRVINQFMVQTGDPDSRTAPKGKMLGSGGLDYTLPAEIVYPAHFHRRGALAAAREGDQVNPERRSSASQFYIVEGVVLNDSVLNQVEQRRLLSQKKKIFDALVSQNRDKIMELRRQRNRQGLELLQDSLVAQAERQAGANPDKLTPEQRQAYTTEGGTPHLDGGYTVFGEVVEGMEVVDAIQKVPTDANDRPIDDIRIISAKRLK